MPSDRPRELEPGGPLQLVGLGRGVIEGYFSDITRTFTFGEVDPELVKIGAVVRAANEALGGSRQGGTGCGRVV